MAKGKASKSAKKKNVIKSKVVKAPKSAKSLAKAKPKSKAKVKSIAKNKSFAKPKSIAKPKKALAVKKKTLTKAVAKVNSVSGPQEFFQRKREVIFRDNPEGEISILKLSDSKNYFKLDSWAAKFWTLLDGKQSLNSIIAQIVKQSGLSEADVRGEVQSLVQELLAEELIERL